MVIRASSRILNIYLTDKDYENKKLNRTDCLEELKETFYNLGYSLDRRDYMVIELVMDKFNVTAYFAELILKDFDEYIKAAQELLEELTSERQRK